MTVNRDLQCKRKAPIWMGGVLDDQTPNISGPVTYPKPKILDVESSTLNMNTLAYTAGSKVHLVPAEGIALRLKSN